jgi:hypothetical protein
MKEVTGALKIAAAGDITMLAASILDGKLATGGFYPPQLATGDLPAFAGVTAMLVYNLTTNKLNWSNGAKWSAITSG